MNVKTIRFPIRTDEKLNKIARKLGRTKLQTFVEMVDYFSSTKKDPRDINDEILKNTLMRNHKDYIGFIRTQESDLLIPVKNEVAALLKNSIKINNHFEQDVLAQNKSVLSNQDTQIKILKHTYHLLKENRDSRESLKKLCISIFDQYVTSRNNLNIMASGKEKEALYTSALKQLQTI